MFNQPFPLSISMIRALTLGLNPALALTSPRPSRRELGVDFSVSPPLPPAQDHHPPPSPWWWCSWCLDGGEQKAQRLGAGQVWSGCRYTGLPEIPFKAEGKHGDPRLSCS